MSGSYADPFVTATRYVFTKLAKYVSFYVVVGDKYIELKNTSARFSKDSVVITGDLDVGENEGGIINRLLINVYDKDNNLIASEDVRFEYEVKPGKYRLAFIVNIAKAFSSTAEPACEFLALPEPYLVMHPELKYPILYVGLHRAYDVEATYFNISTVNAVYLIATSKIPFHAGSSFTSHKYFSGRLGRFRTNESGFVNPTFYSYYPQLHTRLVTPVSGISYMVRLADFVAGIGALSGDETVRVYLWPILSYSYIQLPYNIMPGLHDIYTSISPVERDIFENLVYNVGRCTLSLSIMSIDQLWMFGGAEMVLTGDAGSVRYKLPSLAIMYLVDPYSKDLCDIVNSTSRGLFFCNSVPFIDDYVPWHYVNPLIDVVINDPISFDRFKDHQCITFWLGLKKQGKEVKLYSTHIPTGISINRYPPWVKYAYVLNALKDVRKHTYTIYAAIYTANLKRARVYFKGDVEISYLDLLPGTRPTHPLMYDGYWYGSEVKRYVGATGYNLNDVDYVGFDIPKTHYDIFYALIEYKPFVPDITNLKNMLDIYFVNKQPQCFREPEPNKLACYYDCLEDDAIKMIYHKTKPFEDVLIFTLEDDEGYAYIPTVHGAVKFLNPFKYRQQVIENAPEPLPDYIVNAPIYVWLVWSIASGQFISRDEPNTPYILTNPAYEHVLRLPENYPP